MKEKNQQVYYAEIDGERLPHCCGVQETGGYTLESDNRYYPVAWEKGKMYDRLDLDEFYLTEREAWQVALEQQREEAGARPIIFTFVKRKGSRKFDNEDLRTLVNEQDDHLFIHSFTNPGSGNVVEMWVLTNGSK